MIASPISKRRFAALILAALTTVTQADEFRALWADAFHTGFRTPAQTTQLVVDARRGNFNAIVVQMRKRGDAYYESAFEPKAVNVSPQSYDPLADLIAKAHAGPEPLEVHAWIVTYNIWNSENGVPSQPTHPFRLHPEWLTQRQDGTTFDGANHSFDPAHPEVQEFTFDVAMDIVSRYGVDGIHFDYIRYSEAGAGINSNPWGYNPVAVARFNRLHGRTGTPRPNDPLFLQFRRDQVTALVRKTYLHTWAIKPNVRVSAATILFSNPPANATESAFAATEAYTRVLQDWRGWMAEGILDMNMPMNYRDQDTRGASFLTWRDRAADMQFNRHASLGIGIYLNDPADGIAQMRAARGQSPTGNALAGLVGYSYAVTNDEGLSRSTFLDALTTPSEFDSGPVPIFDAPVATPAMPWKTDMTLGNLMGTVKGEGAEDPADGATVTLEGPVSVIAQADATGFYGFVGLPVGTYTMSVAPPPGSDLPPAFHRVTVVGATVAEADVVLTEFPFSITSLDYDALNGGWRIVWTSSPGRVYTVETSPDCLSWTPLVSEVPAASEGGPVEYRDFTADPNAPARFYRVTSP